MFCPNCRKQTENNEVNCQSCGAQITPKGELKLQSESIKEIYDTGISPINKAEDKASIIVIRGIATSVVGFLFAGSVYKNLYNPSTSSIDIFSVIVVVCGIFLIIVGILNCIKGLFILKNLNTNTINTNDSKRITIIENIVNISSKILGSMFEFGITVFWCIIMFFFARAALRNWDDNGAFYLSVSLVVLAILIKGFVDRIKNFINK